MKDPDSVQLKIKDRLKNNIRPSALGLFDIITEEWDGKDILKIIVASGSEKPYHLKKFGMSEKGCYIRFGSAAEPMSQKLIEELFATRTRNSIGKIKAHRQDLRFEQLHILSGKIKAPQQTIQEKFRANYDRRRLELCSIFIS